MGKISFLSSPPGDSMRLAGRISVTAGDKIALSLGTVAPNCFPNGYEETYLPFFISCIRGRIVDVCRNKPFVIL